jgi:uncharacterized protein YjbJ (UPF0337 family)
MNWQQVKTNWTTVSKQFHTRWGKLSEADLKAIAGRREELVSRLQKAYALDKAKAETEAEEFVKTLH